MQLGSGDIGVSTSTGSELGLDLVQALPTDPIQVVDPLEQGVVSESTQVVGPVDPIHAVDQMHPVQFVDPMHVVDPVHVVESATPVDKEQHVPDCGLVTQSPVDQVQVVISSSDQVVVSDCSNQFTTLSESDSRLVREASKGVAELMMELKQANKNVPKVKQNRQAIRAINNDQGQLLEGIDQIAEEAVNFFQRLLGVQTESVVECPISFLNELLGCSFSAEAKQSLQVRVTRDEIKASMFAQNSDKAPGPDGKLNLLSLGALNIHGFLYQCSLGDLDLHPHCTTLLPAFPLPDSDMVIYIGEKIKSKCLKGQSKKR
ncbi:hypothetical protein V6N11_072768 [Hibiscus sabdariffa]|uniref:Uncharacterized protein n=2 Tax=Hibiscus sabdariffa TaxID=183260 RepID=A0ABR2C6Q1_9ROSI